MSKRMTAIPGIRMIAITGSVAANDCRDTDDIDIMVVTKSNSLWIIRPFFLIFLSLFYKRRKRGMDSLVKNNFCVNLWLDESAITLSKTKRSLYTAHEVLQIIPLLNKDNIYERFITQNSWANKYFANAYYSITSHLSHKSLAECHSGLRPGIQVFASALLVPLNLFFYLLQYLYMLPVKTTEEISPNHAFLHTKNYNYLIEKYLSN
jgi:hypothetical protein